MYYIGSAMKPPAYPEGFSEVGKNFLNLIFQRDPKLRPNVRTLLKHPFITGEPVVYKNGIGRPSLTDKSRSLPYGAIEGAIHVLFEVKQVTKVDVGENENENEKEKEADKGFVAINYHIKNNQEEKKKGK